MLLNYFPALSVRHPISYKPILVPYWINVKTGEIKKYHNVNPEEWKNSMGGVEEEAWKMKIQRDSKTNVLSFIKKVFV